MEHPATFIGDDEALWEPVGGIPGVENLLSGLNRSF